MMETQGQFNNRMLGLSGLLAAILVLTNVPAWGAVSGTGTSTNTGTSSSSYQNQSQTSTNTNTSTNRFPSSFDSAYFRKRSRTNSRPNVVLFMADDHGANDLGCYGNDAIRTPNLDQLAREGMRFTNAFLTTSSCSPSRASILTGRYPHNTGAEDLHQPLPSSQKSLAYYLEQNGYYCASVGKWNLGEAEKTNWDTVVECSAGVMADETLKVFDNRPQDEPFFLWIASKDPHRPYQEGTLTPPHDPDNVPVPPYLPEHPAIQRDLALYYDEISRFDAKVGLIRKEMASAGVLDNTIIIYMSDNGMPFPRAKTTLYDSGIRTPLIVWWPGRVPAGSVQRHLVSSIDIAPTLLSIIGIQQTTMQGKNILPMWRYPHVSARNAVFAEANWHGYEKFTRAVRTERFKLIRNYYWDTPLWNSVDSIDSRTWRGMLEMKSSGQLTKAQSKLFRPKRPFEEFYDLEQDPNELRNRIHQDKYRRKRNHLRTLLDNWRIRTQDQMPKQRRRDGWTREGVPLRHNQPSYNRYLHPAETNKFVW